MRSLRSRTKESATLWSGDAGSPLPTERRGSLAGHLLGYESGQFDERLRRRRGWIGGNNGLAGVSTDHHLRIDRHLPEERDAQHLGSAFPAAVTEDFLALP